MQGNTRLMPHRFAPLRAALAVVLALAVLVAGTAEASVSRLEKSVTQRVYNELGASEYPAGSNYVPNKPYGNLGQPWCAYFVTWALRASGIDPAAYRGSFNTNVAKAWAYYGAGGGGYGRWGTAQNAMPGDLLIDRYDGTPSTGGHIAVVVGPHPDGPRYVWTVGGNEGDAVRLQRKDLTLNSRYLVTLAEFRTRKEDLWKDNVSYYSDIGDVYFRRFYQAGERMQVTRVTMSNGFSYTPSSSPTLHDSTFRTYSNVGTYWADQMLYTTQHAYVNLRRASTEDASLLVAPTWIDPARATSSSSTS